MDTQTVLTIIEMIETRISYIQAGSGHFFEWDRGALDELSDLQHRLQDYIEARVSAMENRTEQ